MASLRTKRLKILLQIHAQILKNPKPHLPNSIISAFSHSPNPSHGILIYNLMFQNSISPDTFTFTHTLKLCSLLPHLPKGKEIHGCMVKTGFQSDIFSLNSLTHMYSLSKDMGSALQVFEAIPQRDVVSWTSIICGFLRNGLEREAVSAFASMDMRPNARTLVSLLSACSKSDCNSGFELGGLRVGRSIHGFSVRNMMIEGKRVFCNALMDMYAKCGVVEIARLVFYRMAERDVVSWTTMISGYAHCGCLEEAIGLFDEMLKARVEPNEVTFVSVLHACARSGALGLGKWVHQYMTDKNVKMCLFLENSLVDMYAKCGDLDMAMRIFNAMPHRDVISWNAIICGLAMHGNGTHALELFSLMNNVVVRPDAITYIGVLSACSHAGLIDKGCQYFRMMRDVYDISPRMEHYACMVDLYGRAGLLKEAEDFIRNMPAMPNLHVLGALLNACKIHGDMEMCKRVGDLIKEMGLPITGGIYALIANMYTNANRLVDAIEVRETLRDQGVRKSPGCSWIEVHDR